MSAGSTSSTTGGSVSLTTGLGCPSSGSVAISSSDAGTSGASGHAVHKGTTSGGASGAFRMSVGDTNGAGDAVVTCL